MRTSNRNFANPVLVGAFAGADDSLGSYILPGQLGAELRNAQIFKFNNSITPSDAALSACQRTLSIADVKPTQVDFVISCTQTPDFSSPGLVGILLHKLGGLSCPGLELRQMSVGPLYAIDLAEKLIRTGQARQVLVCCTDLLSRYFGTYDPAAPVNAGTQAAWSCFGDGSAAFLVVDQENSAHRQNSDSFFVFKGGKLGCSSEGREAFWCNLPAARQFPMRITAADVQAGRHYPELWIQKFSAAITPDIMPFNFDSAACAVTHQIFPGMTQILCEQLGVSNVKFYDVFPKRGHVGAAGLPLALAHMPRGRKGDIVALALIGSGISWGVAMLELV